MGGTASRSGTDLVKHCTLWKADRSPACRAVMMAVDFMNLTITEVDMDMDKAEHKSLSFTAMNPMQTLPILKDEELILWDSHVISSYLASRYCNDGTLLPREPAGRAAIEQIMHYNNGILLPKYYAAAHPILYQNCKYIMPQHVSDIEESYANLERMLLGRKWFSDGIAPMLGDICICATVSTLDCMVPIDKYRFPKLWSWLRRMSDQMFYQTGNLKGLSDFSKKIDRDSVVSNVCSPRRQQLQKKPNRK